MGPTRVGAGLLPIVPEQLDSWWVDQVAPDLERRGGGSPADRRLALPSNGIYAQGADLLTPVAEVVHRAGGLLIPDERTDRGRPGP